MVALEYYTNAENVDEYYEYYSQAIEKRNFIPLSIIKESRQINSDYRYTLAPLLIKAFEISFGQEKTIATLKSLLEISKMQSLTIDSWEQAAIKSGISKKSFSGFKKTFLSSKKFKQNTIDLIRKTKVNKVSKK